VKLNGSFANGMFVSARIINVEREPLIGQPLEEEEEKS
jgi:hypothetical protein